MIEDSALTLALPEAEITPVADPVVNEEAAKPPKKKRPSRPRPKKTTPANGTDAPGSPKSTSKGVEATPEKLDLPPNSPPQLENSPPIPQAKETTTSKPEKAEKVEKEEAVGSISAKRRTQILAKLNIIELQHFPVKNSFPPILSKPKSHWDYLMEEAQWTYIDYRQEINWKQTLGKKIAKLCAQAAAKKMDMTCQIIKELRKQPPPSPEIKSLSSNISQKITQKLQLTKSQFESIEKSNQIPKWTANPLTEQDLYYIQNKSLDFIDQDIENVISKVLLIPALPSSESNHDYAWEQYIRNTMSSSSIKTSLSSSSSISDFDRNLMKHQERICEEVYRLNSLGYGCVVSGNPYSGKTVAISHLFLQWLAAPQSISNTSYHSSNIIVIMANKKSILRWLYSLQRYFSNLFDILIWKSNDFPENLHSYVKPTIMLVDLDHLSHFLHYTPWLKDEHSPYWNINGIVLDLRGMLKSIHPSQFNLNVFNLFDGRYQTFIDLATQLSPNLTHRIILADDPFREIDRISCLTFLIPNISYSQLLFKFSINHDNYPKEVNASILQVEQANKNTLYQMFNNFNINLPIPLDYNTRAFAQVREETAYCELTSHQQFKYDQLMRVFLCSKFHLGEDVDSFAKLIASMQMLLFHSELIQFNHYDKINPPNNYENGFVLKYRDYLASSYTTNLSSSSLDANSEPTKIRPNPDFFFRDKFLPPTHFLHITSGSILNKLANQTSYQCMDVDQDIFEYSNKIKQLKLLLQRFIGLRVVIVANTWAEIVLIHSYLSLKNIDHLAPHFYLKYGQQFAQYSEEYKQLLQQLFWLSEERNVQSFNDPSVLSCILLTTSSVFQSPNTAPWLADAVIVLSHNWALYNEIKGCFRMRLLRSGPSGDPVTIVRVCSKNTLEEMMMKHRIGIPQLQGIKLSELLLSPYIKTVMDDCDEIFATTLLRTAPNLLVCHQKPTIPSTPTAAAIATTTTANSTVLTHTNSFDTSFSPNILGEGTIELSNSIHSVSSASNPIPPPPPIDSPRASGTGKGMIILGPQGKTQFIQANDTIRASARKALLTELLAFEEDNSKGNKSEKALAQEWLNNYQQSLQQSIYVLINQGSSKRISIMNSLDQVTIKNAYDFIYKYSFQIISARIYSHLISFENSKTTSLCDFGMIFSYLQQILSLSSPIPASSTSSNVVVKLEDGETVLDNTTQEDTAEDESTTSYLLSDSLRKEYCLSTDENCINSMFWTSTVVMPVTETEDPTLPPSENANANKSIHRAPAFFNYRMSLEQMLHDGQEVEPWLYVNPLLLASSMDVSFPEPALHPVGTKLVDTTLSESYPEVRIKYYHKGVLLKPVKRSRPAETAANTNKSNETLDIVDEEEEAKKKMKIELPKGENEFDDNGKDNNLMLNKDMNSLVDVASVFLGDDDTGTPGPMLSYQEAIDLPKDDINNNDLAEVNSESDSNSEPDWLPVEDDMLICMQNAANDPHFVYTLHWLNNAEGIDRSLGPKTSSEVRRRYAQLCSTGKKDERLQDSNIVKTIIKIRRALKRPTSFEGPSSTTQQPANASTTSTQPNNSESKTTNSSNTEVE